MSSPSSPVNDQFIGGDFYNASGNVTIGSNQLLAMLPVTAATGVFSPNAGEQFTVSLLAGPNTSFQDASMAPVSYTTESGTISIESTSSSEPTSLVLAGLAALGGLVCHRRSHARVPKEGGLVTGNCE